MFGIQVYQVFYMTNLFLDLCFSNLDAWTDVIHNEHEEYLAVIKLQMMCYSQVMYSPIQLVIIPEIILSIFNYSANIMVAIFNLSRSWGTRMSINFTQDEKYMNIHGFNVFHMVDVLANFCFSDQIAYPSFIVQMNLLKISVCFNMGF